MKSFFSRTCLLFLFVAGLLLTLCAAEIDLRLQWDEAIPPVGPLDITLRLPRKPAAVTLEPGARPLTCDYRDGELRLTVPKVEIHEIVAVQMK